MTSLFLSESDQVKVSVHPLVVLTVLDAYMRRGTGLNRVIGTLLGTKTANLIEVTTCYCVPHQETADGEIAFDEDYNTKMLSLKKVMAQGEEVVGWFATTGEDGQAVDYSTCVIPDYYGQMCGSSTVHLVVDTACKDNKVAVTAYTGSPLALGAETLASQFQAVPVAVTATSTEKVACDVMIKSVVRGSGEESKEGGSSKSSNQLDDLDSLESSIVRLLEILDTNCDYVDSVLAGKTPKDD
jgi:translation initiation factor 3 subunit F